MVPWKLVLAAVAAVLVPGGAIALVAALAGRAVREGRRVELTHVPVAARARPAASRPV